MMNALLLDIGNTRTKVGVFDQHDDCLFSATELSFDEIKIILEKYNCCKIGIINVQNTPTALTSFLNKIPDEVKVITIHSSLIVPIINLYKTPLTLGVDRLCSAVASTLNYKNKNVLVIDCGTCIKYDLINKKTEYVGGSISPGLLMRYQVMAQNTIKLPVVTYSSLTSFYGNTTQTCINTGIVQGIINEINGFIELYKNEYEDLQIILTGGDAPLFDKSLKYCTFAQPNWVLLGAHIILKYNV